jgi:hypothetical protein
MVGTNPTFHVFLGLRERKTSMPGTKPAIDVSKGDDT